MLVLTFHSIWMWNTASELRWLLILSVDLCTSEESWNCLCHSPFHLWNVIYAGQKAIGRAGSSFLALQLINLHPEAWDTIRSFKTCYYWPLCNPTPFKILQARFGFGRSYSNEFHVPSKYIIINYQMANFWLSKGACSKLASLYSCLYILEFNHLISLTTLKCS